MAAWISIDIAEDNDFSKGWEKIHGCAQFVQDFSETVSASGTARQIDREDGQLMSRRCMCLDAEANEAMI